MDLDPYSGSPSGKNVDSPGFSDTERDDRVYRAYAEELTRFANSMVGPGLAPDIVSSAVLRVFTSRAWKNVTNERAYLYKAVANEARSHHRSAARRRAREQRVAVPDRTEMPEVRPDVAAALAILSTQQRAVAFLTYFMDQDESTVGELLGISSGSVRKHLGRARDRLREVLDA